MQTTETLSESGASTGRITQFDRDVKGRVLQTTFADGLTNSAAYNALGYLTNSVDRAGRTTDYTYAPTKQLTSVTQYLEQGGSNVPVRISYDLDEQMNQLKIIEPRGRYVESYQFDIQDRVTSVTNIEGQVMNIDYGIGDFVNQTTRFDGTSISNAYDQAGRLNYVLYSSASVPLASVDYTYYPDGELQSISDGTSTNTYSYDPLNRLTNTTSSVGNSMFDIQYSHDPIGNLTNSVVSIGGAQASATSYSTFMQRRFYCHPNPLHSKAHTSALFCRQSAWPLTLHHKFFSRTMLQARFGYLRNFCVGRHRFLACARKLFPAGGKWKY